MIESNETGLLGTPNIQMRTYHFTCSHSRYNQKQVPYMQSKSWTCRMASHAYQDAFHALRAKDLWCEQWHSRDTWCP